MPFARFIVPIHNLGYRPWNGTLESTSTRWTVVAEIGIRRAWQSSWLRRMMLFSWLPVLGIGILLFFYEQAEESGQAGQGMSFDGLKLALAASHPERPDQVREVLERMAGKTPDERRHMFWSLIMLNLIRRSQGLLLIAVIGIIAPPLISQDFRSRAFLLYFSRPLTKVQYIIGKGATLLAYLLTITLLPCLLLFILGVLFSPSLMVLKSTWDLPIRILGTSLLISIPAASLALMLSAVTTESRYASFAWFAIWIFGFLAYQSVVPFTQGNNTTVIQCLSLYHLFSDVAGWMLDRELAVVDIQTRMIVLGLITSLSLAVVFRRVSAPMNI
jgi:ABC-2 type transport system permease protein